MLLSHIDCLKRIGYFSYVATLLRRHSMAMTRVSLVLMLMSWTDAHSDSCGQVTMTLSQGQLDSLCGRGDKNNALETQTRPIYDANIMADVNHRLDGVAQLIQSLQAGLETIKLERNDLETKVASLQEEMTRVQGILSSVRAEQVVLEEKVTRLDNETAEWKRIAVMPRPNDIHFRPGTNTILRNNGAHYRDCFQAYVSGSAEKGVYALYPRDMSSLQAPMFTYCDPDGWTMFMRRYDGSVDFYRGWTEYSRGFGYNTGEFWLGLENLHFLTKQDVYELRVEVLSYDNKFYYATYRPFSVGSELSKYKLTVGEMVTGNYMDVMTPLNGLPFTTKDSDNDLWPTNNCAVYYHGGWWLKSCGFDPHRRWCRTTGCMTWGRRIVKKIEMKIRPISAGNFTAHTTATTTCLSTTSEPGVSPGHVMPHGDVRSRAISSPQISTKPTTVTTSATATMSHDGVHFGTPTDQTKTATTTSTTPRPRVPAKSSKRPRSSRRPKKPKKNKGKKMKTKTPSAKKKSTTPTAPKTVSGSVVTIV